MTNNPQVYLASSSPRRQELLRQIGIRFQVLPVTVDEQQHTNESIKDYLFRLALAKANAGLMLSSYQDNIPVIGADTIVVLDQEVLGKPADTNHAKYMLQKLSGRTHQVMTAVAICTSLNKEIVCSESQVTFRDINEVEIDAYIATEEPLDKAGAYAIQGIGAIFIAYLQGSFSGVMGLPLYEVAVTLQKYFNVTAI